MKSEWKWEKNDDDLYQHSEPVIWLIRPKHKMILNKKMQLKEQK